DCNPEATLLLLPPSLLRLGALRGVFIWERKTRLSRVFLLIAGSTRDPVLCRLRLGEAHSLRQLVVQLGEIGVVASPVDVGEAEVEIAERAAHGDVGQREVDAGAEGLLAQALAHGLQARAHFPDL